MTVVRSSKFRSYLDSEAALLAAATWAAQTGRLMIRIEWDGRNLLAVLTALEGTGAWVRIVTSKVLLPTLLVQLPGNMPGHHLEAGDSLTIYAPGMSQAGHTRP